MSRESRPFVSARPLARALLAGAAGASCVVAAPAFAEASSASAPASQNAKSIASPAASRLSGDAQVDVGLGRDEASSEGARARERVYFAEARGRERVYGLQVAGRWAFVLGGEGNTRPVFGLRVAARGERLEGAREDAVSGRDARLATAGWRYGGCAGLTWRPVSFAEAWFCNGVSTVRRATRFALAGRERARWSDVDTAIDQSVGVRAWILPALALGASYDWHPSLATFRGGLTYAF